MSRAEAVTALAVRLLPSCGSVERAWAAAVALCGFYLRGEGSAAQVVWSPGADAEDWRRVVTQALSQTLAGEPVASVRCPVLTDEQTAWLLEHHPMTVAATEALALATRKRGQRSMSGTVDRVARLARVIMTASEALPIAPATRWTVAILLAAWWLDKRDIGATFALKTAGLDLAPASLLFEQSSVAVICATAMLELDESEPSETTRRVVEFAQSGDVQALTRLYDSPWFGRAVSIVAEVYPLPSQPQNDRWLAALLIRGYSKDEALRLLAGPATEGGHVND